MNNTLFIEPKALIEKLDKTNLKILDATFYLPDSGLIAEDEYQKEHIPNSSFFDINKHAGVGENPGRDDSRALGPEKLILRSV
mgnify:CR=1 FL=1